MELQVAYLAGCATCPALWIGFCAAFALWWAVRRCIEEGPDAEWTKRKE